MPLLVNLKPSGKHLMEDFYYAGGLPVVLNRLKPLLHNEVITANGKSLGENYEDVVCYDDDVISSLENPLKKEAGIAVLKGNLCMDGSVIKPSAASEHLMKHTGKAVVFETMEDYHDRIDDPDLDIDKDSVIVLKGVGPRGYPGMPEVGNVDLPEKLIMQGVKDMVRISDGRMSGTAGGTVILHVSPESTIGGNLAFVENGDLIELDVEARSLNLMISEQEFAKRRSEWKVPESLAKRGYVKLYVDHVEQAHKGADFDFLVGGSGSKVERDSH